VIDSLTPLNAADFKQRYLRSYGFLVGDDNTRKLVYISEVASRMVKFSCLEGKDFFVNAGSGVNFEFLPITRGWFNTRNGPVLLQRVPAKQYTRGISGNNTRVYQLNKSGDVVQCDISLDVLLDVFVNKPPMKPEDGVLINKFFLLAKGNVYFYNEVVGTYKNNKIALTEASVRQELSDFIRRQELPYVLVNAIN
jgi:hypothetical protein